MNNLVQQQPETFSFSLNVLQWLQDLYFSKCLSIYALDFRSNSLLLRLREHKNLCNCHHSLLFLFFLQRFWTDWPNFFAFFYSVVAVNICDKTWAYLVDTLEKRYVYALEFRVSEDRITCALEMNSNDEFKRECGMSKQEVVQV